MSEYPKHDEELLQSLLKTSIIQKAPPSCVYIPEYISLDEEKYITKCIVESPKPKWTQLSNRRLQNWGGLPHAKGMVAEPIPKWLAGYCTKISKFGVFGGNVANHVLVNEYLPSQGIMPHVDGDLYYPTITTISLGSHTVLNFYTPRHKDDQSVPDARSWSERLVTSLLLEPRSLLLLSDDLYTRYLHGIDCISKDRITEDIANLEACNTAIVGDVLPRQTRISLTIRYVPKVINSKVFAKFWTR